MKEIPAYRGWDDDLRLLRAPHRAEVEAKDQDEKQARILRRLPQVCQCHDVIMRKVLPVDGDKIHHGGTYRFRLRVKERLSWSPWTEFSVPVHVIVPPPQPALPLKDPQNPVPPPSIEVQLTRGGASAETTLADFITTSGPSDVKLRLSWPRFDGRMNEVEYRVIMWTLSPDQRHRAAIRETADGKGRCMLPPLIGTQTFVMNLGGAPPVQLDDTGAPVRLGAGSGQQQGTTPAAVVKPRAQVHTVGKEFDVNTQHGVDAPQVIAHVRPFEPTRANTLRHTPKIAAAANGTEGTQSRVLNVEVSLVALPKGHGYVFGVEAKHSRGTCGNVGGWSAPIFSKVVEFEHAPRQLNLEIDARFGTLLFKGRTCTRAKPIDEQLLLEAPAVSFTDEHSELPSAMPLNPGEDSWPLNTSPGRGKYLVRSKGRSVYSERLELDDDLTMGHLAEGRPQRDDLREG